MSYQKLKDAESNDVRATDVSFQHSSAETETNCDLISGTIFFLKF